MRTGAAYGAPALAGAAVVLLVVDVVLLALVVRTATVSARVTTSVISARAPQAAPVLILPTWDPRTSRSNGTPTATATPERIVPATPEQALTTQADSITQPQSTITPATPEPSPMTLAPLAESTTQPQTARAPATVRASSSTIITIPTPPLPPAAGASIAPDFSIDPATETPETTETPVADPRETPPVDPTETPVDNAGETPPPPTPSGTYDDLADLETFFRLYRSTIAGQPFDIVSLTMDTTDSAAPRFVLEVAGSETNDVFAARSAADVLAYGRGLLDDAKSYLGGGHCAVAVVSTYETPNRDACSYSPAWCQVEAGDLATVTWTYVRGSYAGGPNTLETWIAGP
jgi:hypothetical protein